MDFDSCIISYLSGNSVSLGLVVRTNKDRLQVQSETDKTERVTEKNLLANHGPAGSGGAAAFDAVRRRIESARADLDLELLWESLLDAEVNEEMGPEALADEYFGEHRPEQIAAITEALVDDPVRFHRRGILFLPRSHEEAEEILELRRKRAEKAALRDAEEEWIGVILRHRGDAPAEVPEEFGPLVQKCLDLLLLGTNSDVIATLSKLRPKDTPQHTALLILQNTGRLPEGADPFLLENGIHAGFSQAVLAAADEIPEYVSDERRRDFTSLPTFSIDDADTREVDDAISVVAEGEETVVCIHIADPAHFVHKDDSLDRVAAERPLTLYLPTTTVTMLPERIGCDLSSLREGHLRPSLSFEVRFGPDGELRDWTFGGGQVVVTHRLTYEEADAMVEAESDHELAPAMRALVPITDRLREARLEAGGFELSRPEFKVHVENGEIDVQRLSSNTASRRVVSELMVLANRLTAEYALRNDIPIIYRVQDPPSQKVQSLTEYDPVAFMNEVRKIKRTRLSTHPQAHTGLGLDLYTQVSSPIRRYADLVIQRQLAAHVEGEPFPYSQEELFEVVGNVDRTSYQNRQLEREENRHWLLEYAKRNLMDEPHTATVTQINGRVIFAELTAIGERGLLHTRTPVKVGDQLDVRIKDIRPQKSEFVLETV